jgi:hypothetical protein
LIANQLKQHALQRATEIELRRQAQPQPQSQSQGDTDSTTMATTMTTTTTTTGKAPPQSMIDIDGTHSSSNDDEQLHMQQLALYQQELADSTFSQDSDELNDDDDALDSTQDSSTSDNNSFDISNIDADTYHELPPALQLQVLKQLRSAKKRFDSDSIVNRWLSKQQAACTTPIKHRSSSLDVRS